MSAHTVHQLSQGRALEGVSGVPQIVTVDITGRPALARIGPSLREAAPSQLAALDADKREPVRPGSGVLFTTGAR